MILESKWRYAGWVERSTGAYNLHIIRDDCRTRDAIEKTPWMASIVCARLYEGPTSWLVRSRDGVREYPDLDTALMATKLLNSTVGN